jgi:hypothetical protein
VAARADERAPFLRFPAAPAPGPPVRWTATGLEPQVFLDRTGRRGRRVRLAGGGVALLSAGWLAALVTGAIGFSGLPSLPATLAGLRPAPTPARLVAVRLRHPRRRVLETAALEPADPVAAHALARSETQALGGRGG